MSGRSHLLTGDISVSFIQENVHKYALATYCVSESLDNCIAFIDGTVIGIYRPDDYEKRNVAYNGHKLKHALKYQAITSPNGLILHAYGPMEGTRNAGLFIWEVGWMISYRT